MVPRERPGASHHGPFSFRETQVCPTERERETSELNTDATPFMNIGATQTFELPEGWTLRRVATALAREWLAPFRPTVVAKSARWIVQPVVEEPADGQPLWEEGISTAEYEHRLERPDLTWSIRAKSGRLQSVVLARLTLNQNRPMAFDMVCAQDALPETLIDPDQLATFLEAHGLSRTESLLVGLLTDHGFRVGQH